MDLGFYVLASLFGAGYVLNPKKQKRDPNYKTKEQAKDDPNGTNIYNSRDYYKVHEQEAGKVIDNYKKSSDPVSSNIIPMYYNTIYLKDKDVEKVPNPNYKKDLIYSVINSFDQETKKLISSKKESEKIVTDSERNSDSEWGLVNGRPADSKMEGCLDDIGGRIAPSRGYEDFTHNNMVPSYGGRLKQNMNMDNRLAAQKLETFTGQFKLNNQQKREVGPFFSPTYGATNIYGNVEKRDLSRYIPSNTGKKNNELPFEQVKVGPGLNKGFTAAPSGGYHPRLRIRPKTTSELVVNPVFEQEGRINPGKNRINKRGLIQQMYKNKPELLVTNKNGERNFTTVGAIKGRKIRPNIIVRDTHRKKSRQQIGPAKHADGGVTYIAPKTRVSKKVNFYNTPHRNAVLASGKKVNDHGKSGYRNRLNERALTGSRAQILNPKRWVNAIKAYFTDAAKKTRKQHYINHPRSRGNARPQRPSALPAYDPRQALKTTIRETTENFDHKGIVGGVSRRQPAYDPRQVAKTTIRETTENFNRKGNVGSSRKKQIAYDPRQVAKTTIRETTENLNRKGIVGGNGRRQPAYDPCQVAKTTIRETTENKKHKGWLKRLEGKGPVYSTGIEAAPKTTIKETTIDNNYLGHALGEWKAHQTYDPSQRAKTTVKETTENFDHLGGVGSIQKKHIAYDPNERAKTTIKETTENFDHLGGVGSIQKKHIAYDPNQRAKTTIKETTERSDHVGGANRATLQSGKGYYTTNWQANNTNRQFTADYEYTGIANSNAKKTISYDASYNAQVNTEKEKIAKGRKPTKQSTKVINGPSSLNVEMKKLDSDRNNWRSATKTSSVGNYFYPQGISRCTNTTDKNYLPQNDTRLDVSLLNAYKCNPLTQSLNSYY